MKVFALMRLILVLTFAKNIERPPATSEQRNRQILHLIAPYDFEVEMKAYLFMLLDGRSGSSLTIQRNTYPWVNHVRFLWTCSGCRKSQGLTSTQPTYSTYKYPTWLHQDVFYGLRERSPSGRDHKSRDRSFARLHRHDSRVMTRRLRKYLQGPKDPTKISCRMCRKSKLQWTNLWETRPPTLNKEHR